MKGEGEEYIPKDKGRIKIWGQAVVIKRYRKLIN